jgi:C1A family cysteine protease
VADSLAFRGGAIDAPDALLDELPAAAPALVDAALPSSFSIAKEMTEARDQGDRLTCSAFAVIGALEFKFKTNLSEAHLISGTKKQHNECKSDEFDPGRYMVFCQKNGVTDEAHWAYVGAEHTPPCAEREPALGSKRYKFDGLETVFRVQGRQLQGGGGQVGGPIVDLIKPFLAGKRRPIVVPLPRFKGSNSFWESGLESGDVPDPPSMAQASDGHCIVICGYDDRSRRLQFKNSWGTRWGTRAYRPGFGTISYNYVDRFATYGISGW